MTTLEDFLASLEMKADAATPKWSARERNPSSPYREYEIVQATGGILFRSTSYGNMAEDAEFIGALCPETVKRLIAIIRRQAEALTKIEDDAVCMCASGCGCNHQFAAKVTTDVEAIARGEG